MKLCWDNLDGLEYVGNGTWCRRDTNHYFIIKDKCIGCGDEFLTYKCDNADYCSMSCARLYSNPMNVEGVKKRHKIACNKYEHRKKISDHHRGLKRPDHSKFMEKNNPMFNKKTIEHHQKVMSSKEYKKNMSEIIKKRWESEEYRFNYEQTLLKNGLKRSDEELKEIEIYRCKVKAYTKKTLIKFLDKINPDNYPIGIGDGFYNIDHVYSIVDGFENNISPKIIGNYVNLQAISSKENILKNSDSWISKRELIRRFNTHENCI